VSIDEATDTKSAAFRFNMCGQNMSRILEGCDWLLDAVYFECEASACEGPDCARCEKTARKRRVWAVYKEFDTLQQKDALDDGEIHLLGCLGHEYLHCFVAAYGASALHPYTHVQGAHAWEMAASLRSIGAFKNSALERGHAEENRRYRCSPGGGGYKVQLVEGGRVDDGTNTISDVMHLKRSMVRSYIILRDQVSVALTKAQEPPAAAAVVEFKGWSKADVALMEHWLATRPVGKSFCKEEFEATAAKLCSPGGDGHRVSVWYYNLVNRRRRAAKKRAVEDAKTELTKAVSDTDLAEGSRGPGRGRRQDVGRDHPGLCPRRGHVPVAAQGQAAGGQRRRVGAATPRDEAAAGVREK
jgi:hypothetical protein